MKGFKDISLITLPSKPPIALEEAKNYLKVNYSAEDEFILTLIKAVAKAAENYLSCTLLPSTYLLKFKGHITSILTIPLGPIKKILSIDIYNRIGEKFVINSSYYKLINKDGILSFQTEIIGDLIEIIYVAGYDEPKDIPAPIKQGMLIHLANLFDNRWGENKFPAATRALYQPYKKVRL